MYSIYTLSCPTTNDVKYIGITTNIKTRYFNHLNQFDGSDKANWVKELLSNNQKPIMSIIDYRDNKKDALKRESELICKYLSDGVSILNSVYQKFYYKFDLNGNLVDIVQGTRQDNLFLKINRHTYNGFVYNTENVFPIWKLEARDKGRSVNKKEIEQYTKDGIFVKSFDGVREACRITNIDHRSISACATNRRPSAGGYVWKYKTKK